MFAVLACEPPDDQRGHGWAGREGEEDEDGAGEGGLGPAHAEPVADARDEDAEGVDGALLDQGDHEGGSHHGPGHAAAVGFAGDMMRLILNVYLALLLGKILVWQSIITESG